MMKGWRFLASHQLGLILLAAIGLATFMGGTLPQSARLSPEQRAAWQTDWDTLSVWLEGLQFSDVYGSAWFQVLVGLLLLNLSIAVVRCSALKWRLWRGRTAGRVVTGSGNRPGRDTPLGTMHGREGVLTRGHAGLPGLPLLHAGLLLLVAGGLLTTVARFGANLELTEGELYSGEEAKLSASVNSWPSPFPGRVRLDDARVVIEEGQYLRDLAAAVTFQLQGSEIQRREVRANQPLVMGDYRLFVDNSFGYSAVLDRLLPDGTRRLLLINFPVPRREWNGDWEASRREVMRLPGAPSLLMDMRLSGGDSPSLAISAQGSTPFEGELLPGDVAELGTFKLHFRGIAPWMGFYVAHEPARELVFAGALLALSGFLLHVAFPFRRVAWRFDGNTWSVRLWAGHGDWQLQEWWERLDRREERA